MLARSWSSHAVALASYAITLLVAAIALRAIGRAGGAVTIFLMAGGVATAFAGIERWRAASPRAQGSNDATGSELLTSK